MTNECLPEESCQVFYLDVRQIFILQFLLKYAGQCLTQKKIAENLGIAYTSVNACLRLLVYHGVVKMVSAGKGRRVNYIPLMDKALKYCKTDFQKQFLRNSYIDKGKEEKIENGNKENLRNRLIGKNLNISIVNRILSKHVVVNGRDYFLVNGKRMTEKKILDYIDGKIDNNGKRYRYFPSKQKSIHCWRNDITGVMQFNLDFDKIEPIYPQEQRYIETYRDMVHGTSFVRIKSKKIVELIREFSPAIFFSKVFHILKRLPKRILNPYRYLIASLKNTYSDENGCLSFVDSGVVPKLKEFFVEFGRGAMTVGEYFSRAIMNIIGRDDISHSTHSRYGELALCFLDENKYIASTKEGY